MILGQCIVCNVLISFDKSILYRLTLLPRPWSYLSWSRYTGYDRWWFIIGIVDEEIVFSLLYQLPFQGTDYNLKFSEFHSCVWHIKQCTVYHMICNLFFFPGFDSDNVHHFMKCGFALNWLVDVCLTRAT